MQDEPNPFATFPTFTPEAPAAPEVQDDHTTTSRKRKGRTPKAANPPNGGQPKRRGRPPRAALPAEGGKPRTVTEPPARRLTAPTYDLAFVQLVLESGIGARHLEMFAQILGAVRSLDRRQQTAILAGLQRALA